MDSFFFHNTYKKYFDEREKNLIIFRKNLSNEDFNTKITFPHSFFVIEDIILFGKTSLPNFTTKRFVEIICNNEHFEADGLFKINFFHTDGSDIYVQAHAKPQIVSSTSLFFNFNNSLFSEIYKKSSVLTIVEKQ